MDDNFGRMLYGDGTGAERPYTGKCSCTGTIGTSVQNGILFGSAGVKFSLEKTGQHVLYQEWGVVSDLRLPLSDSCFYCNHASYL